MEIKINKLPKSEVEIEGEIPFSDLEKHKSSALKNLSSNLSIPGFRKGHVPEKIAIEKIGEGALLAEMAEIALSEAYPKIIIDNKIDPISRPNVTITKLAKGNPLGFKLRVPVIPETKLPDYKQIAKKIVSIKEEIVATKEEKENLINQILDSKKDKDGNRPELTDDFIKTIGDFKDLNDFNEKIESGIKKEKEYREKEKKRIQIMEEIILKSEMDLPDIIIEGELEKMIAGFKSDIEKMGLKVDEYLKNSGKTEEGLRKEWRGEAEKKGKSQLILNKIAIEEKIYPKADDLEKETEHLMSHYKDADKNRVKVYVETMLTNEAVLKFLEEPEKNS